MGLLLLCALEGRGKTPLLKALISSRSFAVLYKGGNHRASLADEQLSQGDEVTGSQTSGRAEPLAVGHAGRALPGTGTWLLQGWRTQSQVMPFPEC